MSAACPQNVAAGGGIDYALTDNNGLYGSPSRCNNISQSLTPKSFIPSIFDLNPFGGAVVGPVAVTQPSIDLHQRTSDSPQWSFRIQHQMAKDMVVEAGYLGTMGIKLQQNVGAGSRPAGCF